MMDFLKRMIVAGCGLGENRRDWFTMVTLASVNFVNGICASQMTSFFPREAETRGARAFEYGLVFGIHDLASFITCIIYGKYVNKLGTTRLVKFGVVMCGLSQFIFGFLYLVSTRSEFISLAFLLSVINALGTSAAYTATYMISAAVFSKNIAASFGVLECVHGLGYALGPSIGGYLYEVGGFVCPFQTMAVLYSLLAVFIFSSLPRLEDANKLDKPQAKLFSVLMMLPVTVGCYTILSAYLGLGFLQAILEPHLRQFNMRPVTVGAIFAITSFTFILTTPLVGRLCDTVISPKKTMVFGTVLIILSFALVGPLPFIPFNTTPWMVYLGMTLHGLGMSCSVVPAFISSIQSAIGRGLPDDITTYGVVTAISTSSVSLGDFIGPTVAGVLYDTVGFRQGTLFVILVYAILLVFMACAACLEGKNRISASDKGQVNHGAILSVSTHEHALNDICAEKYIAHAQISHSVQKTGIGSNTDEAFRKYS